MKEKTVFFFLHLKQDLDLLLPMAQAAQQAGLSVAMGISRPLHQSSPRVFRSCMQSKLPIRILSKWDTGWGKANVFKNIALFVTASESTARPHRPAYGMTHHANRLGIETVTVQHGFDNIGLTYSDDEYPIRKVSFASKHILIWGPLETLHPELDEKIRSRCLSVGCPKITPASSLTLEEAKKYRGVLSVFENLHWSRFSNAYRTAFLEHLSECMSAHPDILFLIKPHPDQRWLAKNSKLLSAFPSNHLLCDPENPRWELVTASELFSVSQGVIATPSTIALDAARARLPVAIVGGQAADLSRYAPLFSLHLAADWSQWILRIQNTEERAKLLQFSDDFISRVLYNGPVFDRILQHFQKWMSHSS